MRQERPYEPGEMNEKLIEKLDQFLVDNDFPSLYRSYAWKRDTYAAGFPDILKLEEQLSIPSKSDSITIDDVRNVARWGELSSWEQINIKDADPFPTLTLLLKGEIRVEEQSIVAHGPEFLAGILNEFAGGIGPTNVSKVLRFALPAQYGAIDSRLVRVFGAGDPINRRHEWLELTADQPTQNRWVIRPNNWLKGYALWISILRYFATKLPDNCPHPEQFIESKLRGYGIWTCSDVEMSLFSYASATIAESKGGDIG